jgi:hypothetical protein
MQDRDDTRAEAVARLGGARRQRASCADCYESARGSLEELPAFTALEAAEEQMAAREAWLKWIDRDY